MTTVRNSIISSIIIDRVFIWAIAHKGIGQDIEYARSSSRPSTCIY